MSWEALTTNEVLTLFNDSETTAYETAKGTAQNVDLAATITLVVNELRDAIKGRTSDVGAAPTIPAGFKKTTIAAVRYEFLNSIPGGKGLLNEERIAANQEYKDFLKEIRAGKVFIPPTSEVTRPGGVMWNSENKIIPRTHPVPPPLQQTGSPSTTQPPYANPDVNDGL